jgi:hypothetical protein
VSVHILSSQQIPDHSVHPSTATPVYSTILTQCLTLSSQNRLAGLFSPKDSTVVDFSSFQISKPERDDISSNRSSFKSENTSNTGLSVLTDADEREGKYSVEG